MTLDRRQSAQLRHQLWDRLCDLVNEASAIADMWWDVDPDIALRHYEVNNLAELRDRAACVDPDAETNFDLNDDPFISRPTKP